MNNEQNAYEAFLNSGKITDYLSYVDIKRQDAQAVSGEQIAYHDGRNCAAGTAN